MGHLIRERSGADERVVNVSLSPEGRRVVARIKQYRRRFFAAICRRLTAAECRALIESHRHIFETYRRILGGERSPRTSSFK
jgi:DNA-binding MarR family transcriptional regulator